jgi:hypothetical protein
MGYLQFCTFPLLVLSCIRRPSENGSHIVIFSIKRRAPKSESKTARLIREPVGSNMLCYFKVIIEPAYITN